MTLISAGCATLPGSPAATAVQIPRDCERLAANVDAPSVAAGMSAKLALAQHRGALGRANGNLTATRVCQERQRERFAGADS